MTPLGLVKYEEVFVSKQIDVSKKEEKARMTASAFCAPEPLTRTVYRGLVHAGNCNELHFYELQNDKGAELGQRCSFIPSPD